MFPAAKSICESSLIKVYDLVNRKILKADSHVPGNWIRPKQKWIICYWRLFCITVFNRRAPVEDNTALESIRTVAATYGCKILQLCEYDANVYGYDKNCEWHP